MSTSDPANITDKQRKILEYLQEEVDTRTYFKSRNIAEETNLSAKEIGRNMCNIMEKDTDLVIEKWGGSKSITWKVTRYRQNHGK